MDPDQTPGLAPVCQRCGRCCRYGPSINANKADLERWVAGNRTDILRFFEAYCTDGTYVSCASFSTAETLSGVLWTDMINPETGDYYKDCPFLNPLPEGKWYCSIYETRPSICIRFRPWEWGERGVFFDCPVVSRLRREDSAWISLGSVHPEKKECAADTDKPGNIEDHTGSKEIHHHTREEGRNDKSNRKNSVHQR